MWSWYPRKLFTKQLQNGGWIWQPTRGSSHYITSLLDQNGRHLCNCNIEKTTNSTSHNTKIHSSSNVCTKIPILWKFHITYAKLPREQRFSCRCVGKSCMIPRDQINVDDAMQNRTVCLLSSVYKSVVWICEYDDLISPPNLILKAVNKCFYLCSLWYLHWKLHHTIYVAWLVIQWQTSNNTFCPVIGSVAIDRKHVYVWHL